MRFLILILFLTACGNEDAHYPSKKISPITPYEKSELVEFFYFTGWEWTAAKCVSFEGQDYLEINRYFWDTVPDENKSLILEQLSVCETSWFSFYPE